MPKLISTLLVNLLLICLPMSLAAQELRLADEQELPAANYLARIEVHTSEELNKLLLRAEQLFLTGKFMPGVDAPVAFVLHGAEAKVLLKDNYQQHQALVNLSARLSAFQVVEVKVCRTWMGHEDIDERDLPPFVSTVELGVEETRRLLKDEGYVYF